jgi:two-component system, LytTR family, response regulator
MINAVILDNEKHFVIVFSKILKINFPEINLLGYAHNIAEGVELIKASKPDLVFLDIDFSGETGFDLFAHFDRINFDVIFVTSHEEYAIKAIKYAAFDYIVKPVGPEVLRQSIDRYKEKKSSALVNKEAIQLLLENFKNKSFRKIAFSTSKGIRIVPIDQILRCEADTSYCNVFLVNQEKLSLSKNLKDVEELLPADAFMRVHKSHLVNINYIREFVHKDAGTIIMTDNSEISVASRKREFVIDFLKKMGSL